MYSNCDRLCCRTVGSGVPIPIVEKVPSPWNTPGNRKADSTFEFPTSQKETPTDMTKITKSCCKKLPSPWSTIRPWDVVRKKSSLSQSSQSEIPSQETCEKQNLIPLPQSFSPILESQECLGSPAQPMPGVIAITSVRSSVLKLCMSAVEKLDGFTLWSNNARNKESITHLVVGDDRRTLKVMLGVINGAYFLTPEWLIASMEAGRWLPQEDFLAPIRFQEAASRAREHNIKNLGNTAMLHDLKVAVYTANRKTAGDCYQAVRRIANELGAKVVPVSECDICIVLDDVLRVRPTSMPKEAVAVRKEWIFQICERYENLPPEEFIMI